ncbi:hypothetical protein [Amycolatopsis orientalis]|uniref:nSTAND3 domain-containing NTPase n=1 Tax=Amycolatopsis orientalis TaxID=31958 RepID=UPI0003F7F2A9|nr:hypothetical protein [Amycolatopsis orientalis]
MTITGFQLHTLGWRAFQDMGQVVLREVLGQELEVYSDTNDIGQDGAFAGRATPVPAGHLRGIHGAVVAQMKHTSRAGAHLALSDLADELSKVERLVERGLCDSYIVLTNFQVTGKVAADVKEQLRDRGVGRVVVLGAEWLSQTIRESPRLRALVPRVYGLGDLGQILDNRIYDQTRAVLDSLQDDLATFVVTDGYRAAIDALDAHGFVLLLGEPGAGKTVTAATIAAAASDQWGLRVAQIDHPAQMRHWNPEEPQLLWADDAFGAMNLDRSLMDPWNRTLSLVRAIVRNRSRVILTSRDYIWRAARRLLKETAFPFLAEDRVTIDVTTFSRLEKEKILYAHLRAGRQPAEFRTVAKPHLRALCDEVDLLPETARRLADPFFTEGIDPASPDDLKLFIAHPKEYLQDLLDKLDASHEAAIALVFAHGGRLSCPLMPTSGDEVLIGDIGTTAAEVRSSLGNLNGTLLHTDAVRGHYEFRHPSVGDAYAILLAQQPEKLVIWLQGAPMQQILTEATVNIDDLDRPGVAIPPSLHSHLVGRLDACPREKIMEVLTFLSGRCSAEFARAILADRPQLTEPLTHPGMYLSNFTPAVLLLNVLHSQGVLPEAARLAFVEHVTELAIEGPDTAWCSVRNVVEILTESERLSIRQVVRTALLEDGADDLVNGWDTFNYPGIDWGSPESYVDPLVEAVADLRKEFADDPTALNALDGVEAHAHSLEESLLEDHPESGPARSRSHERIASPTTSPRPSNLRTGRDPFDDVDR